MPSNRGFGIITSSAKRKFSVKFISTEEIFNFKFWWNRLYKKTTHFIETVTSPRYLKIAFSVSIFHHFVVTDEVFGIVRACSMINGANTHAFRLGLPRVSYENINFPDI